MFYSENRVRLADPVWLDTANVPVGGSVDLIMDFTDPIIRGMSLFHCHLLNHEDKTMPLNVGTVYVYSEQSLAIHRSNRVG